LAETPAGGSCDLSAANGRKRFRDDADDAACEVGHGRERVLAARAEVAAGGRWPGGKRPFGWELDQNPVDAGGTPVLDDEGNPVKGILPLRQDEADALAQARRDVPGGATAGGITREPGHPGHPCPYREAVARTRSRAGAPQGTERGSDGVPGQDHRDRAVACGRG
jgi:site-specific DNA recombinase